MSYNRKRYYTPSLSTQLNSSYEAHRATQERLQKVQEQNKSLAADRNKFRIIAEHLMYEWLTNNGWDPKNITEEVLAEQLENAYTEATKGD